MSCESATAVDIAIRSRLKSDSSMPARPWVMPSHMAGTPPANCARPPARTIDFFSTSGTSRKGWWAESMSLYDDTMATLGLRPERRPERTGSSEAAKPWARLAHASRPRAGPLSAAASMRAR